MSYTKKTSKIWLNSPVYSGSCIFFCKRKDVKSGSIKNIDLTSGWKVSTTCLLLGIHTDVFATGVSKTM